MKYSVGHFGLVKHDQAEKLDEHMDNMLKQFRTSYIEEGGDVNSIVYQWERKECAKLIAKSLLEFAEKHQGRNITNIATEIKISVASVETDFNIRSVTTFNGEEANENLFNQIMGYNHS